MRNAALNKLQIGRVESLYDLNEHIMTLSTGTF
jgi:hypothetical protein